ncbi:hypothetical protein [Methanimicrococcus hongohii]|nr:hypothetical protein [Methanimicrococcus sp. Hf6]
MSDIVNTATVFVLGELSTEKTNSNFDYTAFVENIPDDNSARTKISIALSGYLDAELEDLAKSTHKNKSYIVRMALFRFFDFCNDPEKIKIHATDSEDKITISKKELEEMVYEVVNKVIKENK